MFTLMMVGGGILALLSLVTFIATRGIGSATYLTSLISMFWGIAIAILGYYLSHR
jgi:steroid 5-alpha reductase family enzyme